MSPLLAEAAPRVEGKPGRSAARPRLERPGKPGRRYTVEQFERLLDTKGFELVDGVPVEKPMGSESDYISVTLIVLLRTYVDRNRSGFVGGPEAGFVLDLGGGRTQLRKPDVSFVARGRYPDDRPPRQSYPRFAPDFAFESVSPRDGADKLQVKVEEYLKAGTRLVWAAYPAAQVVLAFRPDGSVRRHTAADVLSADDLFPGFVCPVSELLAVV